MLCKYVCGHVAYVRLCLCCIRALVFMLHLHALVFMSCTCACVHVLHVCLCSCFVCVLVFMMQGHELVEVHEIGVINCQR